MKCTKVQRRMEGNTEAHKEETGVCVKQQAKTVT